MDTRPIPRPENYNPNCDWAEYYYQEEVSTPTGNCFLVSSLAIGNVLLLGYLLYRFLQ